MTRGEAGLVGYHVYRSLKVGALTAARTAPASLFPGSVWSYHDRGLTSDRLA